MLHTSSQEIPHCFHHGGCFSAIFRRDGNFPSRSRCRSVPAIPPCRRWDSTLISGTAREELAEQHAARIGDLARQDAQDQRLDETEEAIETSEKQVRLLFTLTRTEDWMRPTAATPTEDRSAAEITRELEQSLETPLLPNRGKVRQQSAEAKRRAEEALRRSPIGRGDW